MIIDGDAARAGEPVAARAIRAATLARRCIDLNEAAQARAYAEAALTVLLDDPSPKVRAAMADVLSTSAHAPLHLITALAADQPDVAGYVLARSLLLTDADLVDRVAFGAPVVQRLVAARPHVSCAVSAAIGEVGSPEAVLELLQNRCARIAGVSFRRVCERLGADGPVREALLAHPKLPAECRHILAAKLGETLRSLPLVSRLLGERRSEKVVRQATSRASMQIAESCPPEELPALVEHLRLSGEITTAFILRATAGGQIDFLAAILAALSEVEPARIAAILSRGRPAALAALFRSAGLAEATHAPLSTAIAAWRAVTAGASDAGPAEIARVMLETVGRGRFAAANDDLAALLRAMHLEFMRETAPERLKALSAA